MPKSIFQKIKDIFEKKIIIGSVVSIIGLTTDGYGTKECWRPNFGKSTELAQVQIRDTPQFKELNQFLYKNSMGYRLFGFLFYYDYFELNILLCNKNESNVSFEYSPNSSATVTFPNIPENTKSKINNSDLIDMYGATIYRFEGANISELSCGINNAKGLLIKGYYKPEVEQHRIENGKHTIVFKQIHPNN